MWNQANEERVWRLAGSQKWLITRAQLADLGLGDAATNHRVGRFRLWRVYPGVYALGNPEMNPARERLAAVLACGAGAGLSGVSAAIQWKTWEGPAPRRHHVSIPSRSGRTGARPSDYDQGGEIAAHIQIHRPRVLVRGVDLVEYEGIPVTSLARTARDLAGTLEPWALRKFLRQTERVHSFDLRALAAEVADAPSVAWRSRRLRRALGYILDDSGMTQTEREALFLDICRRHGLPQPRPQRPHGTRRMDFVYDDLWLIVEIDDRQSHDGYVAFVEDRKRDRANANRGFETIRFTVSECRHEPALVAADTAQAIARRRLLLAA